MYPFNDFVANYALMPPPPMEGTCLPPIPKSVQAALLQLKIVFHQILLTLSLVGGRSGGCADSFPCLTQLSLSLVGLGLSGGFDNIELIKCVPKKNLIALSGSR